MQGSIKVKSCFNVDWSYNLYYRFAEGSTVYRIDKAKKGILERIAIKLVRFVPDQTQYVVMYVDTYNAIYAERDLCTQSEAITFAIQYYQNQKVLLEEELTKYVC
jgi:hypothetical protein